VLIQEGLTAFFVEILIELKSQFSSIRIYIYFSSYITPKRMEECCLLLFRNIDLPRDSETIIKFRRDSYIISFGDERLFGDNVSYLKKIAERLLKFPGGLIIVEVDGEPVGQVELQIKKVENKEIGYVNLFYLIPEYRGKGYGVYLIKYTEDFFSKYDVKEYQLRVSPTNKRAIKFYEKTGFQLIKIEEEETVPRYRMHKLITNLC
jgi:GNAT superfamily N-acetyltransferase